jgi:tetratricopeptide (TPR) repeat protein
MRNEQMSMNGDKGNAMRLPLRGGRVLALAAVAMIGLSSTLACTKIGQLQAMMTLKRGNQAYAAQDWKGAATQYELTIQSDPTLNTVYFYLGNSYDNLYKPRAKGDPANDALIDKAVQNYLLAAERLSANNPQEAGLKRLTLEYLVAAYGSDKLNDPVKAEPVVQQLIQLAPGESANYFALAKIYEDAGVYEEGEKVLLMAKDARPDDPAVYMQLAGYYNRQGMFDKTIDALNQRTAKEPNNPEAFYTVSTYYWDKAYRDVKLKDSEKMDFVMSGLGAIDKALQIRPDYVEAIVYKNLLLRLQANLEKSPAKQQELIKQADVLRDHADELRKAKASGVGL